MRVIAAILLVLAVVFARPVAAGRWWWRLAVVDVLAAAAVAASTVPGRGVGWQAGLPLLLLAEAAWLLRGARSRRPAAGAPGGVAWVLPALLLAVPCVATVRGPVLGEALGAAGAGLVAAVAAGSPPGQVAALLLCCSGLLLAAVAVPAMQGAALLPLLAVRALLCVVLHRLTLAERPPGSGAEPDAAAGADPGVEYGA